MDFRTEKSRRNWVETSFLILLKECGFPKNKGEQIIINEQYFPKTFSSKKFELENIFEDLISILDLNSKKITLETSYDLTDSSIYAIASQGETNEIHVTVPNENEFCFFIANSLKITQKKIIYNLVIEFIRVKLMTNQLFKDEKNISEHFLYLAGVYFGFGIILFENRYEVGFVRSGFRKTQWHFSSPMLPENILYSFAFCCKLFPNSNFNWIKHLPNEIQKNNVELMRNIESNFRLNNLLKEINSLEINPKISIEKSEIITESLKNTIQSAEENILFATRKNNFGYRKLKEGLVEESIPYFREAIEMRDNFGFANDNLGYALILKGELEEGFKYLNEALKTGTNNKGYSCRNFGLYFHKKGNLEEAKKNYELAYENQTIPIDFLDVHFSELLSDLGEENVDF